MPVTISNLHGAFNRRAFSGHSIRCIVFWVNVRRATRSTLALRLISRIIIGDVSDIKAKFYGAALANGTRAFAF